MINMHSLNLFAAHAWALASARFRSMGSAWLAVAALVLITVQSRAAGPVLSDANLFAALNLDYPGMEVVKTNVTAGNYAAAKASLATYLRSRTNVTWYWDPHTLTTNVGYNQTSADQYVGGYVFYSGVGHTFPGGNIDWFYNVTKDPGNSYPDNNEWQWQLNRFGEWGNLGATYWGTSNESYAVAWVGQLRDWLTSCPVPTTEQNVAPSAWRTIESGLRMGGNWHNAYHRFLHSPSFTDQDVCDYLKSCIEHGRYLLAYPSSGNWLMIEMSGLYTEGALFPELNEAGNWRTTAANSLAAEQVIQFYPDGPQKELSPVYHSGTLGSILNIYNMATLQGRRGELPANFVSGLEKSYEHYLRLMAPDRKLPQFNDCNGVIDAKSGLSAGYSLFPNRTDFQWVASDGASGTPPNFTSTTYPWAGYNVMRSGWSTSDNYLCFDAGPLGTGHYHQDKLNVVLSAYGKKILFDSGGGEYESSIWRTYGSATWSHNTVIVDGNNQVGGDGSDTYTDPDHTTQSPQTWRWESDVAHDFAAGTYNRGYNNYFLRPATHTRRVLFVKPDLYLIADTLVGNGLSHSYQARWHLLPTTSVTDPVTKVITTTQAGQPNLAVVPCLLSGLTVGSAVGQSSGSASGLLGWDIVSDSVGHYPATTVTHQLSGTGTKHFLTLLMPLRTGETNPVSAVVNLSATSARVELADGRKLIVSADANSARGLKLTELLADNSTNRVVGGGFTPPTISAIADQVTAVSTPVGPVAFTVGSTAHAAASLVVSARSLDTRNVQSSGIALGGSGTARTVTITPVPNRNATATIIVTVMDPDGDTTSTEFTVTIGTGAQADEDYFWGNTSDSSPMSTALKWAWDSEGSGLWNNGPGTGDVAHFGNWHGFQPSDGGQTYAWGGIRFTRQDWFMNTAPGGQIALKGVANDWIIKADFTGGGANVIHSPLALNMNDGFIDMVGSGSTLTLNGIIKNGTGTGLGIRGNGTVVLAATNTYTGATTVNGGTLEIVGNPIAPSSGVFINSGTVVLKDFNSLGMSFWKPVTIASGGRMTMNGDYSVNIGPVTLNGGDLSSDGFSTVTWGSYTLQGDVTAGAGTSTISAVNVNGSGARTFTVASGGNLNVTGTFSYMTVIKAGAGTMTFSGANTYTDPTTVSQGTLAFVGGSQRSPITVSAGASLGFTLGSPTTSTSSFNLSAGTIKLTGTPTLPSYTLITASSGITGTPTLNAPISGYGLVVEGTSLKLVQTVTTTPLIAAGSTWKFFDTGTAPATWMQNEFNDAAWPAGPAILGFGDLNGQAPATSVNSTPSRITTYFRRTFTVANPRQFADLTLRLLRDDGAVVWLNGVEVHRSNMVTKPALIGSSTQALSTVSGADENTFFTATLDARELRTGTNVIAVEVHQFGTASSDLGFDLSLDVALDIPAPLIAAGASWKYRDTGIAPPANWTSNDYADTAWTTGPARLGYGDTQATTVAYGTEVNNRHITTWFRHTFTVADATLFDALRLELQRDDGAVVYLNGVELLRDNLPSSAITPTRLATTAIGGTDETAWNVFTVPATALLTGTNTVAIELHQSTANSSDLGLDLRLSGLRQTASTFADWQAAQFGSDKTNAALAGPLTDLDKDGLVTLLEYAFASDPRTANQDAAPTATTASGRLALQFERNPAATDITIKVQAADTLTGPWTDLATSTTGNPFAATTPGTTIIETTTGPLRTVEVRDLYPLNDPLHPRRFMRVHVTQP